MFHKITIAGRVTRDPEMRYMPDGTAVTTVSMAVDGGYGENKHTIWFRASFWRKQAEIVNQYVSKGSKLLVDGVLRADTNTGGPKLWTRQDGSVGASFEITGRDCAFLSSKAETAAAAQGNYGGGGGQSYGGNSGSGSGGGQSYGGAQVVEEDDIPFARPAFLLGEDNPIGHSVQENGVREDWPIF